MTLRKRLAGNVAANIFLNFANVIVQLTGVSLFLAFWTKEKYGEWLMISSLPGYLALADAGISGVAANEASMHIASGRPDLALRSLHTALGMLLILCTSLIALSIITAKWIPWNDLLGLTQLSPVDASNCVVIFSLYTIAGLSHSYFLAVYRAVDQFPRCVYIIGWSRISEVAASAVCLALGGSLIALSITLTTVRLIFGITMGVDLRLRAKNITIGLSEFSILEVKRTWRLALASLIFPAGNALYFQGLTMLTGRLLGPTAVVYFNTARILTRSISQMVAVLKNSTAPLFSVLYGADEKKQAKKLNQINFEMALIVSTGMIALLLVAGPYITNLWTGGSIELSSCMIVLFGVGAGIGSLWNINSALIMGSNQHSSLALLYLLSAVISLIVAFVLAPQLGVAGIGWAMLLCEIMMLPIVIWQSCRIVDQPPRKFIGDCLQFIELSAIAKRQFSRIWKK